MNLQLNDPAVPAPGEMFQDHMRVSPQPYGGGVLPESSRHIRTPSLGELHQELEAEQEGHVVSNNHHISTAYYWVERVIINETEICRIAF